MSARPTVSAVVALTAIAALASGCGTAADRTQARDAAQRLYAAVQQHDGATACAQMTPALRQQVITDQSESRCEKAVLRLSLHGSRARTVRVYATSAEVQLDHGDTVFLGDTQQGWRVEALGCKPRGNEPYDCLEQA
jgi:hypothetical protein